VEGAARASEQPYGRGRDGHSPRPPVAVHHAASARWGEAARREWNGPSAHWAAALFSFFLNKIAPIKSTILSILKAFS
jgi:hypothetical protein